MIVVPGPSSMKLGEQIAALLGMKRVAVEYKNFPDGESYQRLTESVDGDDVVLVHTAYPNQDKRLIELLIMIDGLKSLGASKVRVVVPYMAYARQDTRFREGEVVSIGSLFKMIQSAGADEFYTVDLHKEASLSTFGIKARNLYATDVIAEYLIHSGLEEPYILSPDKGAIMIAKRIGERMGAEYGNFEKTRDRITGAITVRGEKVDARGRNVAIVDDLISTGGTIANAAKILKDGGAKRIVALCSHPLLVAGAYERMRGAGVDEVLGTDTVESEVSKISVAPLIAKGLQ